MMAQTQNLFIGTYTNTGSEGIYVYDFDESNGKARLMGHTTGVSNPSYLAVSTNRKFIYAVNENQGSQPPMVSAFEVDSGNASLNLLNQQPAEGGAPCYISVTRDGKWVVSGNYSGGNLVLYPVGENGELLKARQVIQHKGSSVDPKRQEGPHVHSVVFSPDEKFLMVQDLGIDKIMIYSFDPSRPTVLEPAKPAFVSTGAGGGPRHLVFHPSLPITYLIEEMSGTVSVFGYHDGRLNLLDRVPTHTKDYQGKIGSADIHVSPDGRFLYASNRGDQNSITIFKIKSDGRLEWIEEQSTLGKTPRNFLIHPSGKYLLLANQDTDEVVIFLRDIQTGKLTDSGNRIQAPRPVCLKMTP